MNLLEMDACEERIGKSVTEMTPVELVSYAKLALKVVWDLDLPTTPHAERSIMAALKRTYGSDAGLIIKWALQHEPATYSMFSKGQKWKTDLWYVELQTCLKKQRKSRNTVSEGLSRLQDL